MSESPEFVETASEVASESESFYSESESSTEVETHEDGNQNVNSTTTTTVCTSTEVESSQVEPLVVLDGTPPVVYPRFNPQPYGDALIPIGLPVAQPGMPGMPVAQPGQHTRIQDQTDYHCVIVPFEELDETRKKALDDVAQGFAPMNPDDVKKGFTDAKKKELQTLLENCYDEICYALSVRTNFSLGRRELNALCLSRLAPRVQRPGFFIVALGLYYDEKWVQFKIGEKVQCRSFAPAFEELPDARNFLNQGGTIFYVSAKHKLTAYRISDDPKKPLIMQPDLIGTVTDVDMHYNFVTIELEDGILPLYEDIFPTRTCEEMCEDAKAMMKTVKKDKSKKKKKKIFSLFCKAAEFGSIEAQYRKGVCQIEGFGTTKDEESGVKNILDAIKNMKANPSNSDAFVMVGDMFFKGLYGTEVDLKEAKKWYECVSVFDGKARDRVKEVDAKIKRNSRRGSIFVPHKPSAIGYVDFNPTSLVNKGLQYYNGEGVTRNCAKALECFRAAGELGSPQGKNNAAVILIKGEGVRQNKTEAVRLFEESSNDGYMTATVNLVHCKRLGHCKYEDVDELHEMLQQDTESPEANLMLGLLFLAGKDIPNAKEKLRLAKKGNKSINELARKVLRILKHPVCRLVESSKATKIEFFPWLLSEKL